MTAMISSIHFQGQKIVWAHGLDRNCEKLVYVQKTPKILPKTSFFLQFVPELCAQLIFKLVNTVILKYFSVPIAYQI